MPLMNTLKIREPGTDPCGMPDRTSKGEEGIL
jgi:hypothetical protein